MAVFPREADALEEKGAAGPRRKREEAVGELQHFESGSDYVEAVFG